MTDKPLMLGTLIDAFMRIYGLQPRGPVHHEGMHAMTGLAIGVADELRIKVIEVPLYCVPHQNNGPKGALRKEELLHEQLISSLTGSWELNAEKNGLESREFSRVQAEATLLDEREVEQLFKLGDRLYSRFYALSKTLGRDGKAKTYTQFTEEDVRAIDAAAMGVAQEVYALKREFETAKNREIEMATADIFNRAAAKAGQKPPLVPPPANVPWTRAFFF